MVGSFVTPAEGMTTRCAAVGTAFVSQLPAVCQSVLTAPVQFAVTVGARQGENSEVSPPALVAVAVTRSLVLRATAKVALIVALPLAACVPPAEPRRVCPSPLPEASQAGLEKNSTRNVLLAAESSVP